jgi:glutamyl/glutaminyl-tRNA synthetase
VDEFRAKGYLPEALLNYLALLSWSPGENQEVVPLAEMAKRFSLSDVGHSASVFDEEKLAWVNRHYLKDGDPERLARLSMPYLERAGYITGRVTPEGFAFLVSVVPVFNTSVDRLEQVPQRLHQLFEFSAATALDDATIGTEVREGSARQGISALAEDLRSAPRLVDKQAFRACADRVKQKTGQKGRALFHPIRIALTGAGDGPELDLLVERGADLDPSTGIARITGARERAEQFHAGLRD